MQNALRMHHHLNLRKGHVEKPLRLHHLKPLIAKRRGIYGHLLPHGPVGVLERVLHRHIRKFFPALSPERTARRREQNLLHPITPFPVQRLENRTVFAVHRQNGNAFFLCKRHNDMPCRHQCLLIGKGDVLPRLDGCDSRSDTDHSHNAGNQYFHPLRCGHFQKSFHTAHNADRQILHPLTQVGSRLFLPERGNLRLKFPDLRFQKRYVGACRQGHDLQVPLFSDNVKCLCPDGACGA